MTARHAAPHRLPTRFLLILGSLLLAVILAGGYWWLGDGESPGAKLAKPDDDALPATAWQRAKAGSVREGGVLRLAVQDLPPSYNPVQADGSGASTAQILAPTTGGPVRITADGGWKVDPDYARSVDVVDRKPLRVRVRLNRDAVWQDGEPSTARDMVAFHRAMSGGVKGLEVASTDGWDDIDSVEAGDDRFEYTVEFDQPRSDWPELIYPRLPRDVSTSAKQFNDGFREKAVPSNGPFVVTEIDPKTGTITEERNPRWWGRTPRLDRVVWRIADLDVQAKAFAAEELDAVAVDASSYREASGSGTVQRASGAMWSHLTMNGGSGPLTDVNVRRAVAAAIDRTSLSSSLAERVDAPGRTAGSLLLVPGQRGYRDVASDVLGRGASDARALLGEAGYEFTDGKATRDGEPLTLRLPVPKNTPNNDARVELIKADLENAGFTVETPSVDADRFFPDTVVPLDFDLVTFTWPASPFPVEAASRRFRPVDSPENYTGVSAKKLNKAWDDAMAELDDDRRADRIHDLDEKLLREAVVIPLSVRPEVMVVREGLVNYGAATFEQPDFTIVGFSVEK